MSDSSSVSFSESIDRLKVTYMIRLTTDTIRSTIAISFAITVAAVKRSPFYGQPLKVGTLKTVSH
jgi:hypothetical protein